MKKLISIIILTHVIFNVYSQKGGVQLQMTYSILSIDYPVDDEYKYLRNSGHEIMNNYIGFNVGYQYMIDKKFGIYSDVNLNNNHYNIDALNKNYKADSRSFGPVTSIGFSIGICNRFKLNDKIDLDANLGVVSQISTHPDIDMGEYFTDKLNSYKVKRGSGNGFKIKINFLYPISKLKPNLKLILGYHLTNTYVNHSINAFRSFKNTSTEFISYTTNLSYLYQNFCIGFQF